MQVGLIIPARNEADALGRVLAEIPRTFVQAIIVVDNGSTDGTAQVAAAGGALVVREPVPGYGRACLAGLAALSPATDVVAFLDGDHSDYPEELPRLLAPIAEGRADLVIGSRVQAAQAGSLTIPQRLGNRLACWLLRAFFGARCTDVGPFRAIRRDALERLEMRDRAFGWTAEMQAKAARLGLRMAEVPVRYRPRIGRSKISGTVSGALRAGHGILTTIARVALERRPVSSQRLLIFLKEPAPGRVKTRLAAALGEAGAAALYRVSAELTLERLGVLRQQALLYVDPPEALARIRAWVGAAWALRAQEGSNLGDRLGCAARDAFAHGARRVVLIGTDSPWITPAQIREAFAALERADAVIGPAEDGGYYLIGLSQPAAGLFDGVAWGSPQACAQTMANAQALGWSVRALPQRYDLDYPEDVERFIAEERARGPLAPAVRAMERIISQRRVACQS